MALTTLQRMVRANAMAVIVDGSRTLGSVSATYYEGVKLYSAANFTNDQLDAALQRGSITEVEYLAIVALQGTPEANAWKGI